MLAFDAQDRVLLVRHSYGSRSWMLPGGGIARGEAPLAAAQREFAEEAGCLLGEARVLAVVVEPLSGASNSVHLIAGRFGGMPRADGREIVELACFAADRLPDDLSPRLRGRIESWIALALDR